jgi:general secretion pathway protein C
VIAHLPGEADAPTEHDAARAAAAGPESDPTAPSHHVRDVRAILARNVFDADGGCLAFYTPPHGSDRGAGDADGANNDAPLGPCTDNAARVVGAVDTGDPRTSFALVAGAGGTPTASLARRAGQAIAGDAQRIVESVGWSPMFGAFVVTTDGAPRPRRCFYAQLMPPAPPTTPLRTSSSSSSSSSSHATEPSLAVDGVARTGEAEYTLRRGALNHLLENQAELMTMAQVVPFQQDGRLAGVRLARVRAGSLLGRLGIQDGDVLTRIDGLEMTSPDRWLEAYTRLMRAERAQVTLLRGGQPRTLDVVIR